MSKKEVSGVKRHRVFRCCAAMLRSKNTGRRERVSNFTKTCWIVQMYVANFKVK